MGDDEVHNSFLVRYVCYKCKSMNQATFGFHTAREHVAASHCGHLKSIYEYNCQTCKAKFMSWQYAHCHQVQSSGHIIRQRPMPANKNDIAIRVRECREFDNVLRHRLRVVGLNTDSGRSQWESLRNKEHNRGRTPVYDRVESSDKREQPLLSGRVSLSPYSTMAATKDPRGYAYNNPYDMFNPIRRTPEPSKSRLKEQQKQQIEFSSSCGIRSTTPSHNYSTRSVSRNQIDQQKKMAEEHRKAKERQKYIQTQKVVSLSQSYLNDDRIQTTSLRLLPSPSGREMTPISDRATTPLRSTPERSKSQCRYTGTIEPKIKLLPSVPYGDPSKKKRGRSPGSRSRSRTPISRGVTPIRRTPTRSTRSPSLARSPSIARSPSVPRSKRSRETRTTPIRVYQTRARAKTPVPQICPKPEPQISPKLEPQSPQPEPQNPQPELPTEKAKPGRYADIAAKMFGKAVAKTVYTAYGQSIQEARGTSSKR